MNHTFHPQTELLTTRSFIIFRIIFGLYLATHFGMMIPYANELFGPHGLLGGASANPFRAFWPNPLFTQSGDFLAPLFVIIATIGALFIAWGRSRRFSALIVALIHSCLLTACPLVSNPGLPYLGLLLWLLVIIPSGERWTISEKNIAEPWSVPRGATFTAGFLLAAGYTFSGVSKLSAPGWIDGTALHTVLSTPLAREALPSLLLQLPLFFHQTLTWGTLFLEISYLFLWFIPRCRTILWLGMMSLHFGILFCLDFADLTLGMIMIHLFLIPPSVYLWVEKRLTRQKTLSTPLS
jgi:hypothetical protein